MAHIAFIVVPAPGHLNPLVALATELKRRGHRITFLHHPDVEPMVRERGLDFVPVGNALISPGLLDAALARASAVKGMFGIRAVIRDFARGSRMLCEELPGALSALSADIIVSDWIETASGLVAQKMQMPYVSVAAALPLQWEPGIPSPFVGWSYRDTRWHRYRNAAAQWAADKAQGPINAVIKRYVDKWKLEPRWQMEDWASPFAQIAQLIPALDFPRRSLISCFHYCGPLREPASTSVAKRPGGPRKRAFASLGSLQGHRADIFEWIADATEALDLDLTIAHGGRLDPAAVTRLSRRASVHPYLDYAQIFAETDIAILHGGMNGVLDALANGVPLVVVPVAYEQAAIARRVEFAGAGVGSRPLARGGRLAGKIAQVLSDASYATAAAKIRDDIIAAGGVTRAADIVEQVARTGAPCHNPAVVASNRLRAFESARKGA